MRSSPTATISPFNTPTALAMVGHTEVRIYRKPRVAILPTGDELVQVQERPGQHQIRNSNAWAVATQVQRAGGVAEIVGIARDNYDSTRELVERGFEADL